jgi:hypothetical protein
MPKSRKRRPKQPRRDDRNSQRRASRPLPDPRTYARDIALLQAADEAERRGDAVQALATMASHPEADGFWRPWRVRLLCQIAMFGPLLPRWATSRWICAQALQHLGQPGGPPTHRAQRALEQAVELRGGRDRLPGKDPIDAACRVMDHDWVFRQVHLYELGGLRYFLDRAASPDLVAGADRIRDWAKSSLGGYRLLAQDAATVTWLDLAGREPVLTANIGSAAMVLPGECVIGRMVPIEAGVMFESAPLLVPEDVAAQVALHPSCWLDALRATPGGTTSPDITPVGDSAGLLSDVPVPVWFSAVRVAGGLTDVASAPTPEQLAKASLTLAHAAVGRSWRTEGDEVDTWPCLAAALLTQPIAEALVETVVAADRDVLLRLGELLAEPAASWCRKLADGLTEAA